MKVKCIQFLFHYILTLISLLVCKNIDKIYAYKAPHKAFNKVLLIVTCRALVSSFPQGPNGPFCSHSLVAQAGSGHIRNRPPESYHNNRAQDFAHRYTSTTDIKFFTENEVLGYIKTNNFIWHDGFSLVKVYILGERIVISSHTSKNYYLKILKSTNFGSLYSLQFKH